jgi:hypothetical protein
MTNLDDDLARSIAAVTREVRDDKAAAQANQAKQELLAARRRRRDKIGRAVSPILIVIFVLLTALNVTGRLSFGRTTATPLSDAERSEQLRRTLNYAVRAIDAYRKAHGQWPPSLSAVGAPRDVPLSYVLDNRGGYSITVTDGTLTAKYDSSQDPEDAFADLRHR